MALSTTDNNFNFDNGSYHTIGLEFEEVRFRIPLMFKFNNLKDDGHLLLRFYLLCTLEGNDVLVQIPRQTMINTLIDKMEIA